MKKISKFVLILLAIFLAAILLVSIMPKPRFIELNSNKVVTNVSPEKNFNREKGIILNSAYKLISEKDDNGALLVLQKYESTQDRDILQAIIEIKTRKLMVDLSKAKSDDETNRIKLEISQLKEKSIEINSANYKSIGL